MASQQDLIQGKLLEQQKIVNFAYTAAPAAVIQYVGSKTYCKLTIAAGGDWTIYADDTDGATDTYATFDLSTPAAALDTMGELEAAVNAYSDLRMYLVGEIPSAATDNRFAALSATSIISDNGLTLYTDPAVTGYIVGFAITNEKFTSRPTGGWSTKQQGWQKNTLCVNALDYLDFTLTSVGDGTYQIYSVNGSTVNTLLPAQAFTTATEKIVGSSPTPDAPYIAGNVGERLVVTFDGAAAITAGTVYALGRTKHMTGLRVFGGNYTGCA